VEVSESQLRKKKPSIEQERSMLKLDESLKICLLAVASQYPDSLAEINKDVLECSDLWEGICTVEQALEHLQVHAAHLLQAPACLLIDEEQAISAIYLVDRSEEVPVMHLYCGRYHGRPCLHGLHEPELRLISPY
jgi:hypothetical protein